MARFPDPAPASCSGAGGTLTTTFGQGIAVNVDTFNGSISDNTASRNGAFGLVSGSGSGVESIGANSTLTTTFGQGIFLQATNFQGVLANNTLMNNGAFVAASGAGTNVFTSGSALTIYGQGMLLEGFDNGSIFAFVDNNRFGNNFGTINADSNGTPATDLLALYVGSGKMGVELSGDTTITPLNSPPPFNYEFLNLNSGVFHLANNQSTTGGNGSATPADGVGTDPTAGPVPF